MRLSLCGLGLALVLTSQAGETKDKHLWLEDVTNEKALTWVKERNATSTAELTKDKGFAELKERLLKILDSDERIPFVSKHGEHYYNFWRDANNKRGLWRRTSI